MTRHDSRLSWVAPAVLLLGACATGSLGERVGIDVNGVGSDRIEMRWSEQHAWSPLMAQRGAELVAEYKTPSSGLVREVLASVRGSSERSMAFALPRGLKAAHEGPVCLYLQLPANRSIVPVRKAQGAGVDTARFRFPAWEAGVGAHSALRNVQLEVTALERQVLDLDNATRNRRATLTQRGWATPASCDAIPAVAQAAATAPPIGVLSADAHDAAARHTCVNRMVNSKLARDFLVDEALRSNASDRARALLAEASSMAGMGEQAALAVLQFKAGGDAQAGAVLAARQREAAAYRDDWRQYAPRVGRDYYPAFGQPNDRLSLLNAARSTHLKLIVADNAERLGVPSDRRPELSANETLGLAGAMLDAYQGCVADGRNELKAKLAAWQELQRDSPERNRRIREHFVSECRGQHEQLARLDADRARIATDLAQAQQRQAALPAPGRQATAPVQLLNALSCQ